MYLADLEPYSYSVPEPLSDVLAIGWLDGKHPFARAPIDAELVRRLRQLALTNRVLKMRGVHRCEICGQEWWRDDDPLGVLGHAEIWVPRDGGFFAAPDLLIHYIEDHQYAPPAAFVDAVLALPDDVAALSLDDEVEKRVLAAYERAR